MMDCKKALAAAGGDIDKAIEDLRKDSGLKAATAYCFRVGEEKGGHGLV